MPALPNMRRELFALRVAMGIAVTVAYAEAFGCKRPNVAAACGSRLLRNVKVEERIREIRKEALSKMEGAGFLTLAEKRQGLADIWRCSMSSLLTEDGAVDLAKVRALPAWCVQKIKVTETSTTREQGEALVTVTRRTTELELTDKLRALQVDNELSGDAPVVDDQPMEDRISQRKRAFAMLRTLPGHGGHLLDAIEVPASFSP